MTQQEINDMVDNPEIIPYHEMTIVHETETEKIDKIQSDSETISVEVFQQWNVVEMPDTSPTTNPVSYDSSIKPTSATIQDWASKKDNRVYVSHDPINLVWKDTITTRGDAKLVDKIETKLLSEGWSNPRLDLCFPTDLYVNISGKWVKQDHNFKEIKHQLYRCDQYHVRVWAINDNLVIGSAHEERAFSKLPIDQLDVKHVKGTTPTWERNVPGILYHILQGFDSAEDQVADDFSGGCWSVSKDSRDLNNPYTRTYYLDPMFGKTKVLSSASNDGRATDILCS